MAVNDGLPPTGLTAHDREWVDAIAALPIADTARAMLTPDAPAVEPLGVVTDVLAAHQLHDRRSDPRYPWCVCGWVPDANATSAYEANLSHVAAAVLDALGTGAGQAAVDALEAVRALTYASDDGTEYEHNGHRLWEGEPECPGCWADSIRSAVTSADDGDRDSGGETVGAE